MLMMFARMTCFDVSPVLGLCQRTFMEFVRTATVAHNPRFGEPEKYAEHGGLLFLPADPCWIEWSIGNERVGAWLTLHEDQIGYAFFESPGSNWLGFLELQPDGERFTIRLDTRIPSRGKDREEANTGAGGLLAAALVLINAPHGVVREPIPSHKGLEREVRRLGFGPLKPSHIIRLSDKPQMIGDGHGAGSRKAFHFCRSHIRRLPGGAGQVRVRAHWRGDPSLGFCDNDYSVTRQEAAA